MHNWVVFSLFCVCLCACVCVCVCVCVQENTSPGQKRLSAQTPDGRNMKEASDQLPTEHVRVHVCVCVCVCVRKLNTQTRQTEDQIKGNVKIRLKVQCVVFLVNNRTTQFHTVLFCIHVADPATFLALSLNSIISSCHRVSAGTYVFSTLSWDLLFVITAGSVFSPHVCFALCTSYITAHTECHVSSGGATVRTSTASVPSQKVPLNKRVAAGGEEKSLQGKWISVSLLAAGAWSLKS